MPTGRGHKADPMYKAITWPISMPHGFVLMARTKEKGYLPRKLREAVMADFAEWMLENEDALKDENKKNAMRRAEPLLSSIVDMLKKSRRNWFSTSTLYKQLNTGYETMQIALEILRENDIVAMKHVKWNGKTIPNWKYKRDFDARSLSR
jgi:hypothetical protein